MYKPPYNISKKILDYISKISKLLGKVETLHLLDSNPKLRKKNQIQTIHGTLTIEGNDLGLEKITDILENKKVIGPKKDILEVQNAIKVYSKLKNLKYHSEKDFLKAHKALMQGLIDNNGSYRKKNAGVLKGSIVSHVAPQAKLLPKLMAQLFSYLKDCEEHLLIKSCVFHYELEFIHPFSDGNGRMGRLWQSLILRNFDDSFAYLPVESLIFQSQAKYYKILEECDKKGDSTKFIELILGLIEKTLIELSSDIKPVQLKSQDRIKIAQEKLKKQCFSRKDYIALFQNISTATANRDLKLAVEQGFFKKQGDKRLTEYKVIV